MDLVLDMVLDVEIDLVLVLDMDPLGWILDMDLDSDISDQKESLSFRTGIRGLED